MSQHEKTHKPDTNADNQNKSNTNEKPIAGAVTYTSQLKKDTENGLNLKIARKSLCI